MVGQAPGPDGHRAPPTNAVSLEANDPPPAAQTSLQPSGAGTPLQVLETRGTVVIVDDDEATLDSTALVLESLGYAAVPLADPAKLVDVVAHERPVAILQDLRMGHANIPGVVAALRSDPATSNIPLVFFSANPDIAHTASRYGAWGYLEKPFTPNQLGQVLARAARSAETAAAGNSNLRREARSSFHEYWNTLGALSSYSYLLKQRALKEGKDPLAQNIEDQVLKLQAQTKRLQAYIMAMIG